MTVTPILVDRRNWDVYGPLLKQAVATDQFVACDFEGEDSAKHAGLMALAKRRRPIDHRRNRITGASFYCPAMGDFVFYVDVGHKIVEHRLGYAELREVFAAKRPDAWWVAHNAPYEITAAKICLGIDLGPNIICTMQLAVSAITPTEVPHRDWIMSDLGEMKRLVPKLRELSESGFDPDDGSMDPELSEFVGKIIAKESKSAFSYNGLIKSLSYGYGLKGLVRKFFGHEMTTYEQVLASAGISAKAPAAAPDDDEDDGPELPEDLAPADHMGELTGEQVVAYGCDDAIWALKLFHALLDKIRADNPQDGGAALVDCFFRQENPMAVVFSRIAVGGLVVNAPAIAARRAEERAETAVILRAMKTAVRELLPFHEAPSSTLLKWDTGAAWYGKNGGKYRAQISEWATSPDSDDGFTQVAQTRGAVATAWAADLGHKAKLVGPNLSHYMPVRTLVYDLLAAKAVVSAGKLQSDGEARGKVKDKLTDPRHLAVIDGLTALAGVEQRMKLYLTPYTRLTDPDTGRLYPTVTSMLATRRMAARDPNPMQLAKRGSSTYVRGFFGADSDDHVIVSIDWSSIELVEVAEFSKDPKFCEAYAELPHKDLHAGAAAQILGVEVPELTVDVFKDMPNLDSWEAFAARYPLENGGFLAINLKGEPITQPGGAYKYWRTEIGKGANFNYWYSGFLATIGERMGWNQHTTGEATERYAEHFGVAETWRRGVIEQVARDGFIVMPDGQRYVRYEATPQWLAEFQAKFTSKFDRSNFGKVVWNMGRKLSRRAGNQTVNALIQGSCATIAKRSIIRIETEKRARGWDDRICRFMVPIHDELVFSVHRDYVAAFVRMARGIMIDHPQMFRLCKLDASPSVGLSFEPWHEKKSRLGQVELFELPGHIVGADLHNKRATDEVMQGVTEWLFDQRRLAA